MYEKYNICMVSKVFIFMIYENIKMLCFFNVVKLFEIFV